MDIKTHGLIEQRYSGEPIELAPDFSHVRMETTPVMAVDQEGLVHGGFIFSLADYAAMLAVNDPYVVLGAAEVSFVKPVKAGETLVAKAKVMKKEGKKLQVEVSISENDIVVFTGGFVCFVLGKHVLKK